MSVAEINLIASIFLKCRSCCLTDAELIIEAKNLGKDLSSCRIKEIIHSMAPYLFRLEETPEESYNIFLESPISMCSKYIRSGSCPNIGYDCNRLHICPYFQNCWDKSCKLQHDLNDQLNKKVLENAQCHRLNAKMLVKLIQLKRRSSITYVHKSGKKTRHQNYTHEMKIAFPVCLDKEMLTEKEIRKCMASAGCEVRKIFSYSMNPHFHRWDIVLTNSKDIDNLLSNPLLPYAGTYLRCKPMSPEIDSKSFLLVLDIPSSADRISEEAISTYVRTILADTSYTITSIFNREKQMTLVECPTEIDFKELKRSQKSRCELNGVSVSWVKVYKVEKITIRARHGHFDDDFVKRLIEPHMNEIFDVSTSFPRKFTLEFINSEATRRWFSQRAVIEATHSVVCYPDVRQVEHKD